MEPWRPVSGPIFVSENFGMHKFCRAKYPWIFLDHLYMGFSITPFEEQLAQGSGPILYEIDGNGY